jgi:uncharacterized protein YbjT (DUF2867 family)
MKVFISGATGFLGRPFAQRLIARGIHVKVLVRPGSEHRVARGAQVFVGSVFDADVMRAAVAEGDTFAHLVGTSHPAPWKAKAFHDVDLASLVASLRAVEHVRLRQFLYLSVAHPAPVMRAYTAVRAQCEALIRASGHPATLLRPWYVLGPGRRWPVVLRPLYAVLARIPSTRDTAERLGLVTLDEMVNAMTAAVSEPPAGVRVIEVGEIRRLGGMSTSGEPEPTPGPSDGPSS